MAIPANPAPDADPEAADQIRVSRGVWLPAEIAADTPARLAALLAVLPEQTVFSGLTAAALHDLAVPASAAIDITVVAGRRPPALTTGPRRPELVTHRRILQADEVTEVHGLPVTTVARTWCDLAEVLTLGDLVAAGDSAIRLGRLTAEQAAAAIRQRRSRRGVRAAQQAATLLDGRARSRPESRLRVLIVLAGLPRPAVNEPVFDADGEWLAEPDLSYREARLGIEYQGAVHAEPRQLRRDVARHMDLHRAGWEILYYTAAQVFGHPDVVARDVRTALRQRAPRLLRTRRPLHPVSTSPRE